jgi:hypothetical protein
MAGENRMGRDHLSVGHIRLPLRSIGKSFEHLYSIKNQAIDGTHHETGEANDEAMLIAPTSESINDETISGRRSRRF